MISCCTRSSSAYCVYFVSLQKFSRAVDFDNEAELFDLGRTILSTPAGKEVPAYDLERTICDMIRSRNRVGTETCLAALKRYAASPKKDLNKLYSYAKRMRVGNVLRQYLEVLL